MSWRVAIAFVVPALIPVVAHPDDVQVAMAGHERIQDAVADVDSIYTLGESTIILWSHQNQASDEPLIQAWTAASAARSLLLTDQSLLAFGPLRSALAPSTLQVESAEKIAGFVQCRGAQSVWSWTPTTLRLDTKSQTLTLPIEAMPDSHASCVAGPDSVTLSWLSDSTAKFAVANTRGIFVRDMVWNWDQDPIAVPIGSTLSFPVRHLEEWGYAVESPEEFLPDASAALHFLAECERVNEIGVPQTCVLLDAEHTEHAVIPTTWRPLQIFERDGVWTFIDQFGWSRVSARRDGVTNSRLGAAFRVFGAVANENAVVVCGHNSEGEFVAIVDVATSNIRGSVPVSSCAVDISATDYGVSIFDAASDAAWLLFPADGSSFAADRARPARVVGRDGREISVVSAASEFCPSQAWEIRAKSPAFVWVDPESTEPWRRPTETVVAGPYCGDESPLLRPWYSDTEGLAGAVVYPTRFQSSTLLVAFGAPAVSFAGLLPDPVATWKIQGAPNDLSVTFSGQANVSDLTAAAEQLSLSLRFNARWDTNRARIQTENQELAMSINTDGVLIEGERGFWASPNLWSRLVWSDASGSFTARDSRTGKYWTPDLFWSFQESFAQGLDTR